MEGKGKLYYQSRKLAYDGSWKSDQFSGRGILYNEVPDILESSFNYENFDDVDEYWTKYEGIFHRYRRIVFRRYEKWQGDSLLV